MLGDPQEALAPPSLRLPRLGANRVKCLLARAAMTWLSSAGRLRFTCSRREDPSSPLYVQAGGCRGRAEAMQATPQRWCGDHQDTNLKLFAPLFVCFLYPMRNRKCLCRVPCTIQVECSEAVLHRTQVSAFMAQLQPQNLKLVSDTARIKPPCLGCSATNEARLKIVSLL